jgi:hypothetical protein
LTLFLTCLVIDCYCWYETLSSVQNLQVMNLDSDKNLAGKLNLLSSFTFCYPLASLLGSLFRSLMIHFVSVDTQRWILSSQVQALRWNGVCLNKQIKVKFCPVKFICLCCEILRCDYICWCRPLWGPLWSIAFILEGFGPQYVPGCSR